MIGAFVNGFLASVMWLLLRPYFFVTPFATIGGTTLLLNAMRCFEGNSLRKRWRGVFFLFLCHLSASDVRDTTPVPCPGITTESLPSNRSCATSMTLSPNCSAGATARACACDR